MEQEIIIWKTESKPSHDKSRKKKPLLRDLPKSERQDSVTINISSIVRNGDVYELRNGSEVISTKPYKPWFIVELRNGYFAHLPIKRKEDALQFCVENLRNDEWCAIEFDEKAMKMVILRNLKEKKLWV